MSEPLPLDLREQAQELFAAGKLREALDRFQQLLSQGISDGWIHYHLGCCFSGLGRMQKALGHLNLAAEQIQDPRIEIERCRAWFALGNGSRIVQTAERQGIQGRLWQECQAQILAAPAIVQVAQFLKPRLPALLADAGPKDLWLWFWARNLDAVLELADRRTPFRLSFSPGFPNALLLLTPGEVQRLMRATLKRPLHVAYASWDLPKQLRKTHGALARSVPIHVRRGMAQGGRVIFDACEEAPVMTPTLMQTAARRFGGTAESYLTLTANSILTSPAEVEFNYYPLLVSAEGLREGAPPLPEQGLTPTYGYTLLNGMPRPHRIALMIWLRRTGLLAETDYSWWGHGNQKTVREVEHYLDRTASALLDPPMTEEELEWIRTLPNRIIPGPPAKEGLKNTHYLCDSVNYDYMRSARVHIVAETDFGQAGCLRLTEKSMKPILAGVPFVILGVAGMVAHLRAEGFDVLDDCIDHAYDSETAAQSRLRRLLAELQRLRGLSVPPERLQAAHRANLERLAHWQPERRAQSASALLDWCEQTAEPHGAEKD